MTGVESQTLRKVLITHSPNSNSINAKLKRLEIYIMKKEEYMLETISDKFPTLTHLKLSIRSRNENTIYESLKNISNLKHLIHFEFDYLGKNNNRFCDLLKQMANNCRNLKSIFCLFNICDQNSDKNQLFAHLKAFPLKRLNLFCLMYREADYNFEVNKLFSFELFKGFSNITHLTLHFLNQISNKSIFKDIDINLPNL